MRSTSRRKTITTMLGLVCAIALAAGGPPAAAATSAPYSPRSGVVFNNPKGTMAQQLAIITQLDRALDAAPKGSTVWMAQYLFDIDSTANKMIAAHRRGVNVKVLIDDGEKTAQIRRVRQALGTDKTKGSFVATCRHSCMANTASVMHAKFYLFSTSGAARYVSMISSANPYTGNTFKSWNDLDTIVGDLKMYNSLVLYFQDMLKDQTNLNYYRTTTSGQAKVYLYPRAAQPGVDTIVLLDVLNHVQCAGAAAGYGSQGRTVIRVAMWGWSSARLDIARKLWDLHNQGCFLEVVYNKERTSRSVTATLLRPSTRYGVIPVYNSWVHKHSNDVGKYYYMHLKLLTVNGVWFGHRNTKVTYTGSQNFTGVGTVANNDMILRLLGAATHDLYARNLDFIRDHYTTRVTSTSTTASAPTDKQLSSLSNRE